MREKVSQHFFADEFLHPNTTDISLIDARLIDVAEFIRTTTGRPVTINNYATGGQYKESGLREQNTTTGAKKSAHKLGLAIDVKVKGMTGREMYDWAIKHAYPLYQLGVRRIEDVSLTPTWLHLDLKEHGLGKFIAIIDLKRIVKSIPV